MGDRTNNDGPFQGGSTVRGATLTDQAALTIIRAGAPYAAGTALEQLVGSGVAFVVLGADRGAACRIDPAVAAQALARLEPRLGVFVTADPTRDHPYNLARRVLSLDHLTGGRVGLTLIQDAAVSARAVGTTWSAGVTPADTAEFAHLVTALWNTFPRDALVGDRDTGLFARSERIRRPQHRGRWHVDGPLNSPSSVQGTPPLLWWGSPDSADEAGADLVILSATPSKADSIASRYLTVGVRPGRAESIPFSLDEHDPAPTLRTRLGLSPRFVDVTHLDPAFPPTLDPDGLTS
jgi:alkanesulfonate monooxygenase SsuD/methylene tetrahydromethanopterin reductase-like flavin-dependent oxidoreductase (luciferase family)